MARIRMSTVLTAIEELVSDDAACWWEMLAYSETPEELKDHAAEMQKRIGAVYRLAHGFNIKNSCYHVHDDWRAELHPVQGG